MKAKRTWPEGAVPLLDVEGTALECGEMLGWAWADTLRREAEKPPDEGRPWWATKAAPFAELIARYAPHIPDLHLGMAKGAGVPEDRVGCRAPAEPSGECTSFALQPRATLDGIPISGQTKDTGNSRAFLFVVVRMKLKDGPCALTLTYPGWLYGHGFVQGGCSIFRNSLYAGEGTGRLPYEVWGLLALHCPTVEDVVEMTRRCGVRVAGHCTVADEQGGVAGIEVGKGGVGVRRPKGGIYTHANAVVSGARLRRHEPPEWKGRENSILRETRLRARLEADRGRLTAQLAYCAMTDHEGFPGSVCRHGGNSNTTASVVAEPTRGLLHVSRGHPCQNWPTTYGLQAGGRRSAGPNPAPLRVRPLERG